MVIVCSNDSFPENSKYSEYFDEFSFELSNFQKWSIKAIVDGHHSLITAHTGSGKTLPAEFAIKYFTKQGKKIIYASPLKALSNQKLYDFRRKFPEISFGILTGDVKDNPEADVLIMTTEILRNTLFNKQIIENSNHKHAPLSFEMDFQNELALVCFDEIHFIGDQDRGSVWEQSIIMLPKHVQMLMLSATIDKPENFAKWIELQNPNKNVFLSSTNHRVVPLTHYMWLTMHKSQVAKTEKTPMNEKVREFINKKIEITSSDNKFNEINYYKMVNLKNYISKNQLNIGKKFVLNELIRHLYDAELLPAICFVLSRKNVEIFAHEIEINLFEKESCPPAIEYECKNILYSKFNNKTAQEIMLLPEYIEVVNLLKKGIAVHHAGIMPVIREMVELLFERNYIKLLFATETFAVGINMPTKTVIFTGMNKFNGSINRLLYSHEYKQMAGRAGRRGIDTIGYVIHCNNLFDYPTAYEYKNIITGPPQLLSSKFKVSFNLILNILLGNNDVGFSQLNNFVNKSMISDDIEKEVKLCDDELKTINEEIETKKSLLQYCQTSKEVINDYIDKKNLLPLTSNKTRAKLLREIACLEDCNRNLAQDIKKYEEVNSLMKKLGEVENNKNDAKTYLDFVINSVLEILDKNGFINLIEERKWEVASSGIIAANIQEANPLAISEFYNFTEGFKDWSSGEIAGLFSCFTNITVSDDVKKITTFSKKSPRFEAAGNKLREIYEKYEQLEVNYKINTGSDYNLHFQIMNDVVDWCNSNSEEECIIIIRNIKQNHGIFLGEFIKAILKINNISSEFEKVCESIGNIELLQKMREIPRLTLKYVVTNMSLYV
jgi:superfamily II RNA helicase